MSVEVEKERAARSSSIGDIHGTIGGLSSSEPLAPPSPEEILSTRLKEPRSNEQNEKLQPRSPKTGLPTLPRRKLRALMALYQESATFITPETLDRHIEQEFAISQRQPSYLTQRELEEEARRKKFIPEMTTSSFVQDAPPSISAERRSRSQRLAGALWGVDENGNPTLEAVEEAKELELIPRKDD